MDIKKLMLALLLLIPSPNLTEMMDIGDATVVGQTN